MGLSNNGNPCNDLIAFVASVISLYTINACPRIFIVFRATTSTTLPYCENK